MSLLSKQVYFTSMLCGTFLMSACHNPINNKQIDQHPLAVKQKVSSDAAAHWLTVNKIALKTKTGDYSYQLLSQDAESQKAFSLTKTVLSEEIQQKYPHLKGFTVLTLGLSNEKAKILLKNKLSVATINNKTKQVEHMSLLQIGEVIDYLYTKGEDDANEISDLGATITPRGTQFKLWAPTAKKVSIKAFKDEGSLDEPFAVYPLNEDQHTGIWTLTTDKLAALHYYQYQIEVFHPETGKIEDITTTDPYSLSLSTNSTHSQIVDLDDRATQPENWHLHNIPGIAKPEDNIFYETHVRDFSAHDASISDLNVRGKYKAFSESHSTSINYLKSLQVAGINNIHLLPVFDIGTVNENKNQVISLNDSIEKLCHLDVNITACNTVDKATSINDVLTSFGVKSSDAQQLISQMRQLDNYNWGYDPLHYTVPEGSYATNAMGITRIIEFREMIQSIHEMGFRVIMDVVYNHTHQYGLANNSVLDKVVPGYYHRLNPVTGTVEQSTCFTCGNTATERVMMEKLMTDSLVTWAKDYKIDGFRFDLMGHQPKDIMLKARDSVRKVDSDTYFYGEGWNFGEVADNSRFTQASQLELGGSEIGTFSDRLRDAVRGSGNNTRDTQGIGNGLISLPNERQDATNNQQQQKLIVEQLKIGLAGNLANFDLYGDKSKLGKDVLYGNQPTGYALDPADTINYVSKHDNQTLWDNSQYRLPFDLSTKDRVRLHNLSLSYALYAQGIPFIHMGSELLRSKSFLRDSYDYGDWFNKVDFSMQSNNYNVGLPPADKDEANWPLIQSVIEKHQGRDKPTAEDIQFSQKVFANMVAVRSTSPLLRLATAKQIKDKVSFIDTKSSVTNKATDIGLIAMMIDDREGEQIDDQVEQLLVVFNNNNSEQTFKLTNATDFQLHPVLMHGEDPRLKQVTITTSKITIPALSVAVLVNDKEGIK